jgi:hypothetical protein
VRRQLRHSPSLRPGVPPRRVVGTSAYIQYADALRLAMHRI